MSDRQALLNVQTGADTHGVGLQLTSFELAVAPRHAMFSAHVTVVAKPRIRLSGVPLVATAIVRSLAHEPREPLREGLPERGPEPVPAVVHAVRVAGSNPESVRVENAVSRWRRLRASRKEPRRRAGYNARCTNPLRLDAG